MSAGNAAASPPPSSRTGRASRTSRTWLALLPAGAALVVVLIFILQNHKSAKVSFLWWSGHLSLGVALLLAAALGGLVVFLVGSVRILQLRRATRRSARA